MSKITFLALIAVAIGIAGGVIEVKLHTDKLGALPGNIMALAQDGTLQERVRGTVTGFKREAEFWIIRDEQQRLELATQYIEKDANRLKELLAKKNPLPGLIPQAQLLAASIERAGDVTAASTADNIAAWQDKTKAAFTTAAGSIGELKITHKEYKTLEEKLAAVVQALEKQIGSFEIKPAKDAAVAGTTDEKKEESDRPANSAGRPASTGIVIPLNF